MNPKIQRNSNLVLCYALIGLSFLCIVGTILAAVYFKNGIIERVRNTPDISGISDISRLQAFDRQIQSKEQSIKFEKQMPDLEEIRRKAEKELSKASNKKIETNNTSNVSESKAEKIKKLEDEKAELIAEKNDFQGKMRAKEMKPLSWEDWLYVYNIELLVVAILPLGIFSFYLLRVLFTRKLPDSNPLSLTDVERRCVLFLPFSIVFSAFGFFIFVWVLDFLY